MESPAQPVSGASAPRPGLRRIDPNNPQSIARRAASAQARQNAIDAQTRPDPALPSVRVETRKKGASVPWIPVFLGFNREQVGARLKMLGVRHPLYDFRAVPNTPLAAAVPPGAPLPERIEEIPPEEPPPGAVGDLIRDLHSGTVVQITEITGA